jgi:hypothetical protein
MVQQSFPGAMFLVAYISAIEHSTEESEEMRKHVVYTNTRPRLSARQQCDSPTERLQAIPILGIPACGMYHKTTIFDLILPRVLAGERIGRFELAELGHGGTMS